MKNTYTGIIYCENGHKGQIRRNIIAEQLAECCNEVLYAGTPDNTHPLSGEKVSPLESLISNRKKLFIIVPESSFCFSAQRAIKHAEAIKQGEVKAIESFMTALGAPGGFVIAPPAASVQEIYKALQDVKSEIQEYRPLNEDCKLEWERAFQVFKFPKTVKLELTSRCNFKCKMCLFHGDAYKDAPTYVPQEEFCDMDFELYKKGIDECAEWNKKLPYDIQVLVANRGESLLYKDIVPAVQYATDRGIGVYLTTNAALLNSKKSLEIMQAGIKQITVSLDGINKEDVAKIRLASDKYDVFENFEGLLRIKEEHNFDTAVSVCFTQLQENEEYLPAFIDKHLNRVMSVMVQARFDFDNTKKGKIASDFFARFPDDGRQVCPALFGIDIQADGITWLCPCANQQEDSHAGEFDNNSTIISLYNNLQQVRRKNLSSDYTEGFCCAPCDYWMSYYTYSVEKNDSYQERVTPTGKFYCQLHVQPDTTEKQGLLQKLKSFLRKGA